MRTTTEARCKYCGEAPRVWTAWVIESGGCEFGDHETVEVFLGTEEEADARAVELSRSRSALDAVTPFSYPVTFSYRITRRDSR